MRIYWEIISNTFQSNIAYKIDLVFRLFSRIITILVWVSIWRALYGYTTLTPTGVGDVYLNEMITYVILSTGISIFIRNDIVAKLDNKIKTGEITIDLIKPLSFRANIFCGFLGNLLYVVLFQLVPFLLVAVLLFNIEYPNMQNFILFFICIINGLVLYMYITYVIGLIGFWYLSIWHLGRFLEDMIRFLSGSVIPLWFFPSTLLKISSWLPFRLIYYAPLSIYLGKVNLSQSLLFITQQLIWIGILVALERIIWSKGVKKLVIQGG